jgi:hypothetical protein
MQPTHFKNPLFLWVTSARAAVDYFASSTTSELTVLMKQDQYLMPRLQHVNGSRFPVPSPASRHCTCIDQMYETDQTGPMNCSMSRMRDPIVLSNAMFDQKVLPGSTLASHGFD